MPGATVQTVVLQQQAEQVVAGQAQQGPEVMRAGILREQEQQSMAVTVEREERQRMLEPLEVKLEAAVGAVTLMEQSPIEGAGGVQQAEQD